MNSTELQVNEQSASSKGRSFEDRIVHLYHLLGFQVIPNIELSSKQTDLVCSKLVPGATEVRIYVECKYRDAGSVSNTEVLNFIAAYEALKATHKLSSAVMVSNQPFSQNAKGPISQRSDVRLLTEKELTDEVLNISSSLKSFIQTYKEREIYNCYIKTRFKSSAHAKNEQGTDLYSWVLDWIDGDSRLAVILGDFGSGKTTFLEHLRFRLSTEYISGKSSLIPFYLSLRNFGRSPELKAFIEGQLLHEFGVSDYSHFTHFMNNGRFLLLLDGFDEMGQQIDQDLRKHFFGILTPLFIQGAKAILTCRPAYFITDAELNEVLRMRDEFLERGVSNVSPPSSRIARERASAHDSFAQASSNWLAESTNVNSFSSKDVQMGTLLPFNKGDIEQYLELCDKQINKASGQSWQDLQRRIYSTYDLKDLAARPILLNLIVKTLPLLSPSEEASPVLIYDKYTANWLDHEYAKGEVRWLITKRKKLSFMTKLAYQMYRAGKLKLHHTELSEEIRVEFQVVDPQGLSYLATDIQTCSFLIRNQNGYFEFVHKSFLEFFAAVFLKEEIFSGRTDHLKNDPIASEVLFFLGDFAYIEPKLKRILRGLLKDTLSISGSRRDFLGINLLGALGCSREKFANQNWIDVELEGIRFVKNSFLRCRIHASLLDRTVFDRCDLQSSNFNLRLPEWIEFNGCIADDFNLGIARDQKPVTGGDKAVTPARLKPQTGLGRVSFVDSAVSGGRITVESTILSLKKGKISDTRIKFKGGHLELGEVHHERVEYRSNLKEVSDATSLRRQGGPGKGFIRECSFVDCVFREMDLVETAIENCSFKDCFFLGVRLNQSQKYQIENTQQNVEGIFVSPSGRTPNLEGGDSKAEFDILLKESRSSLEDLLREIRTIRVKRSREALASEMVKGLSREIKLGCIVVLGVDATSKALSSVSAIEKLLVDKIMQKADEA